MQRNHNHPPLVAGPYAYHGRPGPDVTDSPWWVAGPLVLLLALATAGSAYWCRAEVKSPAPLLFGLCLLGWFGAVRGRLPDRLGG